MDFISDAFMAWNDIGLVIMAVVFLAVGSAIMGYEIYWRMRSTRVTGVISGIRVTNETSRNEQRRKREEREIAEQSQDKEPVNIGEEFVKSPGSTTGALVIVVIFLLFPFVFMGIGASMGYQYYDLTRNGVHAQARVVDNERSYDSEGGVSYKAILSFRDYNGVEHRVRDGISYGSSPSFSTGSQIAVYYDADDPQEFVIDDFWHNMGISLAFMGFGGVFILIFTSGLWVKKLKGRAKHPAYSKRSAVQKKDVKYGTYYAVYEYKTPDGVLREQVGGMGSNWILSKMPGRRVSLMVFPNNPEKVRRPSLMLLVFGALFFCPGLIVGYIAFTNFNVNFASVFMILGGLGFIGWRIWRVVRKIPLDDIKDGFAHMKEHGVEARVSSGGGGEKGRLLDVSEIKARAITHAKNARIASYVLIIIGMGLSGGAYYAGQSMLERLNNGVRTSGEVVDFISRYSSSDSGSGYTYYSVVTFTDRSGRDVKFTDSVGSSSRMHDRGDVVDVLYAYDDADDAIIDRGIFNWGLSGGLSFGALILLYIALRNYLLANRYGGARYRGRV